MRPGRLRPTSRWTPSEARPPRARAGCRARGARSLAEPGPCSGDVSRGLRRGACALGLRLDREHVVDDLRGADDGGRCQPLHRCPVGPGRPRRPVPAFGLRRAVWRRAVPGSCRLRRHRPPREDDQPGLKQHRETETRAITVARVFSLSAE